MGNRISIYDYIVNSIKKDGMLPKEFCLDRYFTDEQDFLFDLGVYDGMLFFLTEKNVNKGFYYFIIKLFRTVKEDNIPLYCALIDNYISEEKDIKLMNNMDRIIDWVIDNQDVLDKQIFFKFATAMMLLGRNKETVKLGIILWGTTDVDNFPEILSIMLNLAVCDEFTFFVNDAIGNCKEANEIRFKIAKKVNGWGKIFVVGELEPETDEILEWLITDGCENNVDYSYLAYPISKKIDIEKVLNRDNITKEEFLGLGRILVGLLNEEHFLGISKYKNKIELLTMYIRNIEEKYSDDIQYYRVPIEIARYFTIKGTKQDDEINLMLYLKNMFSIPKIENIVIAALNSDDIDNYKTAMSIIEYYNKKELYNIVYTKFRSDPLKYYYSFYYLMQNRNAQEIIIDDIISTLDKSKYTGNPEPIIGINDNEIMAMTFMIGVLKYYPFCGIRLIELGLKCNLMYPRSAAISTIDDWKNITQMDIDDFPDEIYHNLEELSNKEVIKKYKERINKLLNIEEDLVDFKEPQIELSRIQKPNVHDGNFDCLFEGKIVKEGNKYYDPSLIKSCTKRDIKYMADVQDKNKEYHVEILCDKVGNIEIMTCTCLYKDSCKHQYAVLKYLYNNKKGEGNA